MTLESVGLEELLQELASRRPGESIDLTDAELPSEFEPTLWGTPLWIAHPGATAQYRASPALHAYKFPGGRVRVHRDRFDPKENPLGHFFLDAPELTLATAAAGLAGYVTYRHFERCEATKDEADRRWWLPAAAAAGVALVIWIVVYLLGAIVRVALTAA